MPLKRVTFSGRLYRDDADESCIHTSLLRGCILMGLDIVIGLSVAVLFFFAFSGYMIRPVEYGFYCNDPTISNPLKPNTISTIHLLVMTLAVPFFIIAIMEALIFREAQTTSKIPKFFVAVTTRYLEFVIAYTVMTFMLESMKCAVGRLRPHFLEVCQPDWSKVNCSADSFVYIEEAYCTGPSRRVRTARTSFPSGHTTAAVFATLFIYYYTTGLVKAFANNLSLKRARNFILGFFVMWSTVCAVTRVTDYWHHPTDVLGGVVFGTLGVLIPFSRFNVEKILSDRMMLAKCEKHIQVKTLALRVKLRASRLSTLLRRFSDSNLRPAITSKMVEVATPEVRMSKSKNDMNPVPAFIQERIDLFDKLMAKHKEELANKVTEPIKITLPDGKEFDGESWRTAPIDIAQKISKGLADTAVIAKVNEEVWDLDRPFEGNATLKILKFDDDEAKQVFWHSSAHILGEALERYCGGHLCYGPPIAEGFYYDMHHEGKNVSPDDFPKIDDITKCAVKDKQPFERLEVSKEDLLEMFKYNQFKVRILNEKVKTPTTTVYRCGPLIDLCRGPHVRHTGKIKAMQITKASSSYWEGNAEAESLQRVYGISFPDSKQLKEWQKFQEEAAKRDHRKIGRDQELFFFHPLSPGTAFWYPKGAHIYNKLCDFIKKEYRKRGFTEVISPNMYNSKLWEQSGHWQHYSDDMFKFEIEKEQWGLKPMNCPGHCLMFAHQPHTHNELPFRYADFGVLHRNEASGALSGLTRLRRFQQDDAHIFCREDQIVQEIQACLDFMRHAYNEVFGFTFKLQLSTRPENFLGEIETWDFAEDQLKQALNQFEYPWELNAGDGAFYGPKIDITIQDALKRSHQCATIQLDFQLPIRFDLNYFDANNEKKRPVMIHRAVLGSVERMTAILTEHFAGKWPFWVSPRQAKVISVHESVKDYAKSVQKRLFDAGFEVEFDSDSPDTMNKQIRNAQLAQFNFILVVGQKEKEGGTVNVRTRDNQVRGEVSVEDLIAKFQRFRDEYTKDTENVAEF